MSQVIEAFIPHDVTSGAVPTSVEPLPFGAMRTYLEKATTAVTDMVWDDHRRMPAIAYVAALQRANEGFDLEFDVGARESDAVSYSQLQAVGHAQELEPQGANAGAYIEVARDSPAYWTHAGRLAVDHMVTGLIHAEQPPR